MADLNEILDLVESHLRDDSDVPDELVVELIALLPDTERMSWLALLLLIARNA